MAKEIKKKVVAQKTNTYRLIYIVLCLIFFIVGMATAINLKWVGDDIYITLRYVENFLAGNGLVYNIGERVEGYTDFLWAMILALFQWLKFDPADTANTIGLFSFAAILILFGRISLLLNKTFKFKFYLPFSLIALSLNYDFGIWATSGLETAFYAMLLLCAFYIYFFSARERKKRLLFSGLLLCLSLMTRPDAMLFVLFANGILFLRNLVLRLKFKELLIEQLLFASSTILIYLPYFLWRYNYYGFIFPNTYYDKLGYEVFFEKGFFYLWLYAKCHFTSLLFFLFIPVVFKSLISTKESISKKMSAIFMNRELSAFMVAVFAVLVYLILFVAKVGGDFMYARFVIPCVPFIYFAIEYSANTVVSKKYVNAFFVVVLLLSFQETSIRKSMFMKEKDGKMSSEEIQGVTDERYVYKYQYVLDQDKKIGKLIQPYFKDLDAKILVRGGQACFAYYGKFKYCQEYHGLTDTLIAHSVLKERGGKIGHEKHATVEYLEQKGVNFIFRRSPFKKQQYRFAQFSLTSTIAERAEILSYNRTLFRQLKERFGENFLYTDFELYLDNYIRNILPTKNKEDVKNDYEEFKAYYFLHNDDKQRENTFLNKINS